MFTALTGTNDTRSGAYLTVFMIVLLALFGTPLADFGAQTTVFVSIVSMVMH